MRVFDDLRDINFIKTEHFNLAYKADLYKTACDIAKIAEAEYDVLVSIMKTKPFPRINILITDQADLPNGFATTVMDMTINIYLTNPGPDFIVKHKHWVEFVLLHEMTHILNMSTTQPSCLKYFNNTLLYLPNSFMPMWVLEGITVYNESTILNGRLYDTNYEAFLRAMILDDKTFSIHRAADSHNRRWPYGNLGYLYGGYIIDEYVNNNTDISEFNNINPLTCFPVGTCFPDIMTRIRTGYFPSDMLHMALYKAQIRSDELIKNIVPNDRIALTFNGGKNSNPVIINGELFYNQYSEYQSDMFVSYNNGNPIVHFYTSSTNNYSYNENTDKMYFDYIDAKNNVNYFYDIYEYDFETGNLALLNNTLRGMLPVVLDDETLVFVRNSYDSHFIIIYDLNNQMPVDSMLFDKSYRFYDLNINKEGIILAGVYREGGYADIALIDVSKKTLNFITSSRNTDFAPKWSSMHDGFYFIGDYDGINKVYFYSFSDSSAYSVYKSYYNVMDYAIDEENNIIYVEDLSGDGYNIYRSKLLRDDIPMKPDFVEYTPYYPMMKSDIDISTPTAYFPFLHYSSAGMYYILPFIGQGNSGTYLSMSGLNNNSDITLGTGYSISVNPFTVYFNDDSSYLYDYALSLNLHYLYYNPDLYLYTSFINDSSDIKPDYNEAGLQFVKQFASYAETWGYSLSLSAGFDSSYMAGPYLTLNHSTLDGGIKSIIPSSGTYSSLSIYSYYNDLYSDINYGAILDLSYYNYLFNNNSYYIKLHAEYDNDSSIFIMGENPLSFNLPVLLKHSLFLPVAIDDTTGFLDFSYAQIGTEIPLAYPGMGLPFSWLASTSIQLDYISAGFNCYYLYSFDKAYNNILLNSHLSASIAVGGMTIAKPTVGINYLLNEKRFSLDFYLSF